MISIFVVYMFYVVSTTTIDAITPPRLPPPRYGPTQYIPPLSSNPLYSWGESLAVADRILVVGNPSGNRGVGQVVIYRDISGTANFTTTQSGGGGSGTGGEVLLPPIGPWERFDWISFGSSVAMNALGTRLAVGAPQSFGGSGRVVLVSDIAKPVGRSASLQSSIVLDNPDPVHYEAFGERIVISDSGKDVLVTAMSKYSIASRFSISARNVKGTRYFTEAPGTEIIQSDVILHFSERIRRNATEWVLASTIRAPNILDESRFGASLALTTVRPTRKGGKSFLRLAVGSSTRLEGRYGHGTEGDLVVTGEVILDDSIVHNFRSITVKSGGKLTVYRYDPSTQGGGTMKIKVVNTLYVEYGGTVTVAALGYKGGSHALEDTPPTTGESVTGKLPGGGRAATSTFTGFRACDHDGSQTTKASALLVKNSSLASAEACGGGGGYGTQGKPGTRVQCGTSGAGGLMYGDRTLNTLYRGSGGGSGFPWKVGIGGPGGDGGGVIDIFAKQIINYGLITADGGAGGDGGYYSGAGGGGSGGSIRLRGERLHNAGTIRAVGGAGGVRAKGSGTGGDYSVRGGDGGFGRIRFDFLTITSFGTVSPVAYNQTTYTGSVHIYESGNVSSAWKFIQTVRPKDALFVGHSVAIAGDTLAFGTIQGTENPKTGIYITAKVTNASVQLKYIPSPPQRPGFGSALAFGAGNATSLNLFVRADNGIGVLNPSRVPYTFTEWIPSSANSPFAVSPGRLVTYMPLLLNPSIVVHQLRRNISLGKSRVVCDFTRVTCNTTLRCEARVFDQLGKPHGWHADQNDIIVITQNLGAFSAISRVRFMKLGVYEFFVTPSSTGVGSLFLSYRRLRGNTPFFVTVTPPVLAYLSNVTCPAVVIAGSTFTCTIKTYPENSGEANAARLFSVLVMNLDNTTTELPVVPLESISIAQRRIGVFTFSVPTNAAGLHTVLVKYDRRALKFPNPAFVRVLPEPVELRQSEVLCPPTPIPPNRTVLCTVRFMGPRGTLTGNVQLSRNVTASRLHMLVWWPEARVLDVSWIDVGTVAVLLQFRKIGISPIKTKMIVKSSAVNGVLVQDTVSIPTCTGMISSASELRMIYPSIASSENEIVKTNVYSQIAKMCEKYRV